MIMAAAALHPPGRITRFVRWLFANRLPDFPSPPEQTAADLALDSDGRLLLANTTGQLFRREEDGAFCVTGLGGLGGDPSARLYGPAVRLRGGAAGLAIVRSATGTAVGLRPTY